MFIFAEMETRLIFIITGEQGEGKTIRIKEVVTELKKQKVPVKGFIAEGEWQGDARNAFLIRDIETGKQEPLCSDEFQAGFIQHGRFYFNPVAIDFGERLLQPSAPGEVLVIDEIGVFELQDTVWANRFNYLLHKTKNPLLITVRKFFLDEVIRHFGIEHPFLFSCQQKVNSIIHIILQNISEP